ncbi:oligosaccharyl transferase subunit ost3/OST6 [Modicella reniformis]|uniref:Oligosaccharyl transferase subunit ost3/OST6 n=1 Tax=Modicella reniformis TaxID=1440133 RepID=A0A9P6J516_9FUNG|nr:oligosaccharyl transferase subunit ost3/OST6 [Modicella reniformis]
MGLSSRTFLLAVLILGLVTIFSSSSSSSFVVDAQPNDLEVKVNRLQAKAAKNKGIIDLDSNAFDEVLSKPRNYSMVVLFTAISPEFKCTPCLHFDPEYKLVATGWSKLAGKSKIFFGVIDFKAGQSTFQKFGMNSAPAVLFFPVVDSTSDPPKHERYDFSKSGLQAEPFANWVNSKAGTQFKVQRPFDYVALGVRVLGVLLVLGSVAFIYTKAGKVSSSKHFWCAISLFTIFIMISGHMWNQIRNPPYTVQGRDGRPGFIAQGFQNQFGLETQIVAVLYAFLTGSVISLITVAPRIDNATTQRFVVWASIALFTLMFSVLIQLFRIKNPGYPFTLLFK